MIFEDVRGFGGMSLDPSILDHLGPEPLERGFTTRYLADTLKGSTQAIKVRLLDQSVVAGIGNIYANEALHRARIHPGMPSRDLDETAIRTLRGAIRQTLSAAIRFGSKLQLDFSGSSSKDGLFYFGQSGAASRNPAERFRVYQREAQPCCSCGTPIVRFQQAARSTYACPQCQRVPGPTSASAP
jgi:formamidopyrimidine-DNA glycosylase